MLAASVPCRVLAELRLRRRGRVRTTRHASARQLERLDNQASGNDARRRPRRRITSETPHSRR